MTSGRPYAIVAALLLLVGACDYDLPPEPALALAEGGVFISGQPLRLTFSEPIVPDSLVLRVWRAEYDVEGELVEGLSPEVDRCTLASAPCGDLDLSVAPDALSAEIRLDPEGLGRPDVPWLLEVLPGLKDLGGQRTGRRYLFDYQFLPAPEEATEAIPFEDGMYVIVGSLDDPMPAVLTYISELRALPDGRIALAGAEGDEIGDAPKNTTRPEELFVDATKEGYTVYAVGRLQLQGGERFLSTESIEIDVWTGPILVQLQGVRIHAKIVKDPEGHDRLEGSFSFEGAVLHVNGRETAYEGGTTTLVGVWAPPGTCEEGAPQICGDLCGAVRERGQCHPPDDFPPEGFCE